ncbi:MAG TPA: hypothetical protein VF691_14195, partial [Cytophagaceae bacterium]
MANFSHITDSIPLKKYLISFYEFNFFVEKSGSKICVYSKTLPLPVKFRGDLSKYNNEVKIKNNKAGMTLPKWLDFLSNVTSDKEHAGLIHKGLLKEESQENLQKVTVNTLPGAKDFREPHELSKEEFLAQPLDLVEIADWNARNRKYELDEDKAGKLLCKAFKEGKALDLDKINAAYPYFPKKCIEKNLEIAPILEKIDPQSNFIMALHSEFAEGKKLHKRDLEKLGSAEGINEITTIYELAEYAWVKWYRKLVLSGKGEIEQVYEDVVKFYLNIQPAFT